MRKILEDLIFLGVAKETVDVYGKKWTLQTLTSEKQLEATFATGNYDTLSRIYALKIEILGRALSMVDDIELTEQSETIEFVRRLQSPIVNKLFEEYEKLQAKQGETLKEVEEIKNS